MDKDDGNTGSSAGCIPDFFISEPRRRLPKLDFFRFWGAKTLKEAPFTLYLPGARSAMLKNAPCPLLEGKLTLMSVPPMSTSTRKGTRVLFPRPMLLVPVDN
jgi:hypothetical protein